MITQNSKTAKVVVVGAGLAGSECAWFLANRGIEVILIERKKIALNPSQKNPHFAELVCTNSLKSLQPNSSHGLLKIEMEKLGSLVLKVAHQTAVPAGDALAVDRDLFSAAITKELEAHPKIKIVDQDVSNPTEELKKWEANAIVVATGPLTSVALESWLKELTKDNLYFYDAIAPVVDAETLDYSKLYFKDRHKDPVDSADYLNAPFTKDEYIHFISELKNAEKVKPKNFEEEKFFESCLPIDLMAERGDETARFSCMKPIGLALDPKGKWPYAVLQLRKENLLGSAFNLVGFQTRLTYPEQKRVFRLIPGLENAEFLHFGSVHRNTYLDSSKLINWDLSLKSDPQIYFAGQILGVEGYTESAAMGLYAGLQVFHKISKGVSLEAPATSTPIGALLNYIKTWERPVPSNINFGLLPIVDSSLIDKKIDKKKQRKDIAAKRAIVAMESYYSVLDSVPGNGDFNVLSH